MRLLEKRHFEAKGRENVNSYNAVHVPVLNHLDVETISNTFEDP